MRINRRSARVFGKTTVMSKTYYKGTGYIPRNLRVFGDDVFVSAQAKTQPGSNQQAFFTHKLKYDGSSVKEHSEWLDTYKTTEWASAWGLARAPDGNGVFVAGYGLGTNKKYYGLLVRYHKTGAKVWRTKFAGTSAAFNVTGMSVDKTHSAYTIGTVSQPLDGQKHLGGSDVHIERFNGNGGKMWTRQLGTKADDWGRKIVVHPGGKLFAIGATKSKIGGLPSQGGRDAFLLTLDANGTIEDSVQWGGTADDFAYEMTVAADKTIYVIGVLGTNTVNLTRFGEDGKMKFQKSWMAPGGKLLASTVRATFNGDLLIGGYTNKGFGGLPDPDNWHVFVVRADKLGGIYK